MLKFISRGLVQAQCLYKILGLTPGADVAMIKKAYYKLAQKLHPDINKAETARD